MHRYDIDPGNLPRRRVMRAGAVFATFVAGSSVRGQCSPVWSNVGTSGYTFVAASAAVRATPGVPRPTHVAIGGLAEFGVFNSRVAMSDGWRLSAMGEGAVGGVGPEVHAVAAPQSGPGFGALAYAGGSFLSINGIQTGSIAAWGFDGWASLDNTKKTGSVLGLGWVSTPPLGPALFVGGGTYKSIGGVPIVGLAKWDGASWSPVGLGLAPFVPGQSYHARAFTLYDDDAGGPRTSALYVGGNFAYAGGVLVRDIARWDGANWEALNGGCSGTIRSLCVFDHDGPGPANPSLFVGGPSVDGGGLETNGLARWDGTQWHIVPGWIGNSPHALAVFDDDGPGPNKPALYVGGLNILATGLQPNHIAKWDGQQWSSVGGGVHQAPVATPEVNTFTVLDEDGDGPNPGGLYVGGFFNVAGTIQAPGLARWGCPLPPRCDANCNRDFHPVTGAHMLTVADFACFQTRFVLQDSYADCNESGDLTIADFACFQTKFVSGCP